MLTLSNFSQVIAEQSQVDESATYSNLVDVFNDKINPAFQPYMQVYASDNLMSDITVKVIGLGGNARGVDHYNSRVAIFTMMPDSKIAFKYLAGEMKDIGIKPPPARASKTPEQAVEKLAAWFNKNMNPILDYIHTRWAK